MLGFTQDTIIWSQHVKDLMSMQYIYIRSGQYDIGMDVRPYTLQKDFRLYFLMWSPLTYLMLHHFSTKKKHLPQHYLIPVLFFFSDRKVKTRIHGQSVPFTNVIRKENMCITSTKRMLKEYLQMENFTSPLLAPKV